MYSMSGELYEYIDWKMTISGGSHLKSSDPSTCLLPYAIKNITKKTDWSKFNTLL